MSEIKANFDRGMDDCKNHIPQQLDGDDYLAGYALQYAIQECESALCEEMEEFNECII